MIATVSSVSMAKEKVCARVHLHNNAFFVGLRVRGLRFSIRRRSFKGLENIPGSVLLSSGHWRYYWLAIANLKQLSNWGFMSASPGAGGTRLKSFSLFLCLLHLWIIC